MCSGGRHQGYITSNAIIMEKQVSLKLLPDYTVLKPIFIVIGVRISDLTYINIIQQLRATLLEKLN